MILFTGLLFVTALMPSSRSSTKAATNDLHGLVYRLKENFSRDNGSLYEREIGCYLNAAWVGMLMLTGVALCLRAHRSGAA